MLIVASAVLIAAIWIRRQHKRRERDMQLAAAANL
jgi:hypothetical protein